MQCRFLTSILLVASVLMWASCSSMQDKADPNRLPDGRIGASYQDFLNRSDYRDTRDVWYHDERIEKANTENSKIVVRLGAQRGALYVNDEIAMDSPVCTGRSSYETPRGSFRIIEKVRDYRSRSYGSVYNASGDRVNSDATSSSPVPSGGKFVGASMPLWMRIKDGYGLHVGRVLRDADSHGCVRIPQEACSYLFEKCGEGTRVVIED